MSTTINLDKQKIDRIVKDTLTNLDRNGAHPLEIIVALSQCVGRVIAAFGAHGADDVVMRELVDIAVKQMATAVEYGKGKVKS